MKNKRKGSLGRILSFVLAFSIFMSDHTVMYAMATEDTSEETILDTTDETEAEEVVPDENVSSVDEKEEEVVEEELVEVRQPENFYPDIEPENYGTLATFDEFSRTYHVEGDKYVTVIGYDGNTYLDEDGRLQQVDNTLIEDPMSTFAGISAGARYMNAANDFLAVFNGGTNERNKELLTIASGDYMLSVAPTEGVFENGLTEGNAIRYSNVFPNTDFQYTLVGNSVKEDIILLSKEAPNSFSYVLNTYGLKAQLIRNALYVYEEGTDPELDAIFVLEAPEMIDAADEISFGIRMEATETESGYLITVTADKTWLEAEERVYPVRIDPTAIQVSSSAIRVACAEEGSANTVIGDNSYPYVGYDNGITSGNLAGYGSKHLNCRSYFAIDYDFAALSAEAEIVSATFQVTQKTRWSKGTSEFGLYGVEEEWDVNKLTWNNQLSYNHYFLDSQNASTTRGEALAYDVTEEVSAWINGTQENNGFVMKAMVEAPNESAAASGVSMQCEVFYNNSSSSYAPKLILSWTGDLTDLDQLTLDDTTVNIYPVVARNGDKTCNTLGVVAHGLAKPGSTVTYQLVNGTTGKVEAETELIYPDSSLYAGSYPGALDYKRRLSNWQSQVFGNLNVGQVYYVAAFASEDGEVGKTVISDTFLIYKEGALDLIPRIANHYGVELDTIMSDMRMQDCLTKEGNRLFIRNPKNTSAYTSGELSDYYKAVVDGLLLGRAENCEFGYEPINLNTGNFYMEHEDVSIDDIGGTFGIVRRYNSKGASYRGSFGYGWAFEYDERLGELADGSIIWIEDDGSVMTFSKTAGGYQAPAGCDYLLVKTESGYAITDYATGEKHIFNEYGLLSALEDVEGNRTTLGYDINFHLTQITSPSGKVYTVSLDSQERITAIGLPDGNKITYSYDNAGHLVSATDAAGVIRYEYDSKHLMTAWYDGNGNRVIYNKYDESGRVTAQTDALGETVTLQYESGKTVTTDALGNKTTYYYDEQYRTTKVEYPDGTTKECAYNTAGYLAKETNRVGVTTIYEYDAKGNLTKVNRADGAVRSYTYNINNQLTSITEYDGSITKYTYDEKGRLIEEKDSRGYTTKYSYDEANRPVSVTDANGNTSTYTYEGACVVAATDDMGYKWTYGYDAMNRCTSTTDPLGNTSYTVYDASGRIVREIDENGGKTSYVYDVAGNVIAITDKEGNTTTFTYDKRNSMLSGKDPLGNTLTYTYDAMLNKLTETDAEGQTTTYVYDSMYRVIKSKDALGNEVVYTYDGNNNVLSETDKKGNTTLFTYDTIKNIIQSETDALGNKTTYETDVNGNITKIIYADGSTLQYAYDTEGRLVKTTDALGMQTDITYDGNGNVITITEDGQYTYRYTYDANDRLIKTVDPLGNATAYSYDAVGNLVSVTDPRGNTTTYNYDALSRLTKLVDATGGETTYAYDKESRILSMTAPMGDTTTYKYDAIGQLVAQIDALGNTTEYSYDGISRLLSENNALEGITAYTYNAIGHVLTVTDSLENTHAYTWDKEGNLLTDTYPNGEKDSYTYDANGNILTYTDRYGVVTTYTYDVMNRIIKVADTAGNEMNYTYDAAGNILTQTDVLGRTISYGYDSFGRPVTITDVDGVVTTYEYDALDRLVKTTDGEGKVTAYTYDEAGNLIHTTEPGDAQYTYEYDALNRLKSKVDSIGATTQFSYDKNGNLTGYVDGNGVATAYSYDALNRLATYTDGNGGNTSYSYDALSRLTAVTTPEGLTEQYGYDAVGNMTSVTNALGESTTYTYDNLYRLVQSTSPLGAVETYTYDKHDIVTSVTDPLGNVTTYDVNANGQVETMTQANGGTYKYAYDEVNRLTSIITPLGYETTFTYSLANDILTESDNLNRTTAYTYDIMHRMTSVTDAEGGVTTYTYDERGNQSGVTDALGYSYVYSYDKVDRLITVTDPEEKATALVYDMVGNLTQVTTPGNRTVTYQYDNNYNTVSVTDPMGYVYGYTYDKDDRLTGTKDSLGQTTVYTYDAVNRIVAYQDKLGLTEQYEYDAHGNLVKFTAKDGLVTGYTYDLKDRLTSVTNPMGSVAFYQYDEMDNLIAVTDYLGRGTRYTYDVEGNLTSITDATGRTETMTYDIASRLTSYTSNGGNSIEYDYDKLNDLVEKSYTDAKGKTSAIPVQYTYNVLGQRVEMEDSTGDTEYIYDGLGRLTGVITYRTEKEEGDFIGYTYDEANNLSAVTYPDGTQVSYEYDLNDNLIKVIDREGLETTYVYDALNRVTEIHRPNGVSTYNTYNANDQIIELVNKCDDCDWIISQYSYKYNDSGYISRETAIESLAGYAYDDKHNGKHEDGKHDDLYPHGNNHAKHQKDATFAYQIVETDRTFKYDDAGKLIFAVETEDNYGTYTYTYRYDAMGNRTAVFKKNISGETVESEKYTYNDSNQLESVELYDGKKTTTITYTYDEDGNLISEIGKIGTDKVETYYDYTVENRLEAVYEGDELLMAAAYDGDGNRVFQLNYNLHTDEDWKANSGNGNGNNKDNSGNSSSNNGKTKKNNNGNSTNAEETASQNQSGILFPVSEEVSATEQSLIDKIKTTGKQKNYELIEYINDVNREYVEVLVEQNINGSVDTSYVYGVDRLSLNRFDGSTGYYLYDGRGSVAGLTNEEGQIYQSYRYSVNGEITFGAPQYENEYTYNGESYNPNIESQYLRARYYNVVTATFLTEDSYLGEITNPLTLNRYNYTLSNYLNYQDPSGHKVTKEQLAELSRYYYTRSGRDKYNTGNPTFWMLYRHLDLLDNIGSKNATVDYVTQYNYRNSFLANVAEEVRELRKHQYCQIGDVGFGESTIEYIVLQEGKPFLTPRINNNGSITIGFGYDFFEYENPEMFNRYLYRNAEGELVVKQEMTYEEAIETIHLAGESKKIFEALNSFVNGTGYGNMTAPITINQNQYNALFSYFYSNGANVFKDSKYEEWIEYGGEYAIRAVARIELRDYLIENNGNYDKEKLIELFVASKGANMNYEYKGRRASEAELFGSD